MLPQDTSARAPGPLVAALRRELDTAGKTETHHGQLALLLAERLEAADAETGSGVAALSKELHRLASAALADVKPEPDMLDGLVAEVVDLRTRRRRGSPGAPR